MILSQDQTLVCISGTLSKLVNVSDNDSFEFCTRALSLCVALKGHFLGHALSSFQRSLLLQPKPDLDVQDSFRLPSVDVLSSQGNGDFTVSLEPCQASFATFSIAIAAQAFQPGRSVSHASSVLKGEEVRCVSYDAVAYAFKVTSRSLGLFQPMKQPLSFNSPEREAARQTRSL